MTMPTDPRGLTLWQITSKYFCAGLETDAAGVVVKAAPVLRWCVGRTRAALRPYFARKGWEVRLVRR
jgi:hypothetical protein